MTKKLVFMFSILLAVAISALAADIAGKWVAQVPGRDGANAAVFPFFSRFLGRNCVWK